MIRDLKFGEIEQVGLWTVKRPGVHSIDYLEAIIAALSDIAQMTRDGSPDIRIYPVNGKGGVGVQIYQPWVESFLVIGTWPEHGLIRVYMASCKQFSTWAVTEYLERHVGAIIAHGEFEM